MQSGIESNLATSEAENTFNYGRASATRVRTDWRVFIFGAIMAAYAAVTLLKPGTVLDALWALNKQAHVQLAVLGRMAAVPFGIVSIALACAAVGWFRRRRWGWVLGISIITINAVGDLVNLAIGEHLKGTIGVAIASILLVYMTRPRVRNYFDQTAPAHSI